MTTVQVSLQKRKLPVESSDWGFTANPWGLHPNSRGDLSLLLDNLHSNLEESDTPPDQHVERWFFLNRVSPEKKVWEEVLMIKVEEEWVQLRTMWLQWIISAEYENIEVQVRSMEM